MTNLRITRFKTTGNTSFRVEFNSSLNTLINKSNIVIEPILNTIPVPEILEVNVSDNLLNIKTQPLTPFATYQVFFISNSVKFSSLNGDKFLPQDEKGNVILLQGEAEPASPIKQTLIEYNKDNVYNLDGSNFVSKIIDSQDKVLSEALHDIGQAANDNYMEVNIIDEKKKRGAGAFDRLNEEGAFEVTRVGLSKTGFPLKGSFYYDDFPRSVITLLRTDVQNEILEPGQDSGTFSNLTLNFKNSPVIKLESVIINYYNGSNIVYPIDQYGYQIKDNIYDQEFASTLVSLQDNQARLNSTFFEQSYPPPTAADTITVSYQYKSLGRNIEEDSVVVSQKISIVREIAPPIITEFNLLHAPVVNSDGLTPSYGGVEFLNPIACVPFSEPHPAFVKEIPFRLDGLPSFPGEFSIDYSTGRVFVYGEEKGSGTGAFPPAMNYLYNKSYDNRLDYTYNAETADLAASPLRDLAGQQATVSFNFERVLVPGVDYKSNVHIEVLGERAENRLATLNSVYTVNTPITNVFRVLNETTGEIYSVNRFNDNTIFFSSNDPPNINNEIRERASFLNIENETLLVDGTLFNTKGIRVFKINLLNKSIINSSEDAIGSSFNSSLQFSRADIFEKELYFDWQVLPESYNYNRLEVGQFSVDYTDGVVWVGVSNSQNYDLGTLNYKTGAVETRNKHILSVSGLYNNINPNSNIKINYEYSKFTDSLIYPTSFKVSDERFLNGDQSLPYIYDNGKISVSDNILTVRGIYDGYDLNNNINPINFAENCTWQANTITTNNTTIQLEYTLNIDVGLVINVPFISPGVGISSVLSVFRTSDQVELWDGSGSFSGNTIQLTLYGLPSPGQQVIVRYTISLNGGSTPVVDYDRGGYYVDYNYLADELLLYYEYGDNVIDFRESNSVNEGTEYYVSYKVGALRDSLYANFGTLVDLPIMSSFDTSYNRERYRDALQGALQSFLKGPTVPSMKELVSSITKIDPQIIEAAFQVWSLGISSLFQNGITVNGEPTLAVAKYDNGLLFDKEGQSITMPMSSNLRLEEGNLNFWFIPNWNGIDNDATLTFYPFYRDGYEVSSSNIFIGSTSYNPTIIDGKFSISRFDEVSPEGLPPKIYTNIGIFIYFDIDENKWKVLAKDVTSETHKYTGKIKTTGEMYNVDFIDNLGESTDTLTSITDEITFVWNLDSLDSSSPDGYNINDGYVPNYSFDGIMFMSDDKHYMFDFAEKSNKNRFSIFKDGSGYLNFEIFDNGKSTKETRQYKVSANIQNWKAGQKHFISTSWKLNSYERRDEMHLFIDGFEVPNILKFGGRPEVKIGDKWRTVQPEYVLGTLPKDIIQRNTLQTTINSNIVTDPYFDFAAAGIVPGDTIDILEVGFGSFLITSVSGNSLTLNSPVATTFDDARYSLNSFSSIVSNEIDLSANIAVSILRGSDEFEIPGKRAEFPAYVVSKNSLLQTVITILGPALAGDQILIRTLGLNHRRCLQKVYLWSSENLIKTTLPTPIYLDEVSVIPILLPLLSIGPSNSSIVGPNFVANGIVPTLVSNITEGRRLSIRVTGDNVNFTNPIFVQITGTSTGGPTETLTFTSATNQITLNKWKTITDVQVTVTPFSLLTDSTAIEIKEAFSVTNPDGNSVYPLIRYTYQSGAGTNLQGDGSSTVTGGYFLDTDIGNKFVISSPLSVAGTYSIIGVTDTSTAQLSPAPSTSFSGGEYVIYNTTLGRGGFQNGFFTFEEAGNPGVPYNLPIGDYLFDYSCFLQIGFDNVQDQTIFIGSDFENKKTARGIIDDLTIFSTLLTDVRVGEIPKKSQKYVTTLFTALKQFIPDKQTLVHLSLNDFPIVNDALFYKISNKNYLQSSNSINYLFDQSVVVTERPFIVENKGNLVTTSEGTIEFWVSPMFDTFNDPVIRYYFDAGSYVEEEVTSFTSTTVKITGTTRDIVSVRLMTDKDDNGINYFDGGQILSDHKTLKLGKALPNQLTKVKVTYVPIGYSGDRISIFKDNSGYLVFNVEASGSSYQCKQPIFWQKDTWHRIKAMFKFNRPDNRDELRLFIDGRESGIIRYGQGLLYGQGFVYGQSSIGQDYSKLISDINFNDTIGQFFIGSTFNKTKLANARFDNFKISNISRNPITCSGIPVDENYQFNLDLASPVVEDLYTTLLLNFDTIAEKNEDFAIIRNQYYGIYNFIINVIDSFKIVESSEKTKQILEELIRALKPATSKVQINYIK